MLMKIIYTGAVKKLDNKKRLSRVAATVSNKWEGGAASSWT
jgi:hypothetical protein